MEGPFLFYTIMKNIETFLAELSEKNSQISENLPKKKLTLDFFNSLINFLFPICNEVSSNADRNKVEWASLKLFLKKLLIPLKSVINKDIDDIVDRYFNQIPSIYYDLLSDAEAIYKFDPAAFSIEEILIAYPGFQAILTYRLVHPLHELGIPIIPRIMSEYAHTQTGIDIHPGAQIGKSFFIDHGTGIVIGETTVIGDHVKIYQGVTLGALSVKKEDAKIKRHPTIEDHVIVYSGTTILGGNTVIGHDSVVGGNCWLTRSLEPNSIVYNKSEIRVRNSSEKKTEPINYII